MADFVNTIDLLGDEATAKAIIEKTITEFNDNVVNSIGGYALTACNGLKSVNLPNAKGEVGEYAFSDCSNLSTVNLPLATSLKMNVFAGCALTNINIPSVKTINNRSLQANQQLEMLDLPSLTQISSDALYYCSALKTLILRASQVCALSNTNAFTMTPFAAGKAGGTVYVPSALISQYQTATNWSTLYAAGTCNFVAIEGSEYE